MIVFIEGLDFWNSSWFFYIVHVVPSSLASAGRVKSSLGTIIKSSFSDGKGLLEGYLLLNFLKRFDLLLSSSYLKCCSRASLNYSRIASLSSRDAVVCGEPKTDPSTMKRFLVAPGWDWLIGIEESILTADFYIFNKFLCW